VSRKKFVAVNGRFQNERFRMQNLGTLRPRDGFLVFLINLAQGYAYQFHSRFRVRSEDGILRQAVPENPAQTPVFVTTAFGLQGTDIRQFLQQCGQNPQRALFEVVGRAVIHEPHPGTR
jgi:hypothetical protein